MVDLTRAPLQSPAKSRPSVNPFAQALADAEREKQSGGNLPPSQNSDLFRDALAQTGGNFGDFSSPNNDQSQSQNLAEQQRQLEEKRKKEALRRKLHERVNPVETINVFSAREEQVKKEIDLLRQELRGLSKEIASFHKEVELTLMTEVSNPGADGKYYLSFFQQLRSFIMLLRQKVSSARTWSTQMHSKKNKKNGKAGAGMMISGQDYEKTTTIQDMMHHERSSTYSGG